MKDQRRDCKIVICYLLTSFFTYISVHSNLITYLLVYSAYIVAYIHST